MLSEERKGLIRARLRAEKRVLVSDLSGEFGVSEETIRRDLEKLEKEGFASRVYGGAVLSEDRGAVPYTVRRATNIEAKRELAKKVAGLISDGEFVMLDESSTSYFVAQALKGKKDLTVITNSIEIIIELAGVEGWQIMSTGGALKRDSLALTGRQAESFISGYHVGTAVISCTGLDLNAGYTDAGEDNAVIKRVMMDAADKTILAADSGKFGKKAFAAIGSIPELAALVTDTEPDLEWRNLLKESGVELIY